MQLGECERRAVLCCILGRPDGVSVHGRVGTHMTLLVLCDLSCSHVAQNLTVHSYS